MPIDYKKWDHIEISDDEDDTHPNIDTPSLFRWRHQARVEREEQFNEEKKEMEKDMRAHREKFEACKQVLEKARKEKAANLPELEKAMVEMKKEDKRMREMEEDFLKKERLKPWNVDTICHEGKSKTVINKATTSDSAPATEEELVERLKNFVDKNEKLIKKFGMLRRPDDSQNFLVENPHLVCEETANHLVLWCIDLAVEEKFDLMNHVTHQTIVMQFMLELAKSMKVDPRACIRPFFAKFKTQEPEYMRAFQEELDAFRERVRKRAEARIEEAMAEVEADERQARLGPGGLDPVEVFETLPKELQECFESKNIEKLQEVITTLDPDSATYHMRRCVDSGLWVPEKGATAEGDDEKEEKQDGDASEETYDEVAPSLEDLD